MLISIKHAQNVFAVISVVANGVSAAKKVHGWIKKG